MPVVETLSLRWTQRQSVRSSSRVYQLWGRQQSFQLQRLQLWELGLEQRSYCYRPCRSNSRLAWVSTPHRSGRRTAVGSRTVAPSCLGPCRRRESDSLELSEQPRPWKSRGVQPRARTMTLWAHIPYRRRCFEKPSASTRPWTRIVPGVSGPALPSTTPPTPCCLVCPPSTTGVPRSHRASPSSRSKAAVLAPLPLWTAKTVGKGIGPKTPRQQSTPRLAEAPWICRHEMKCHFGRRFQIESPWRSGRAAPSGPRPSQRQH
mmetsp:Transcript_38185/g.114177  ORF Transcript_38185/g.114177 Transcript_38185/m.114177 type:complete len:261 (-) Transcript_38185:567-1349(-)